MQVETKPPNGKCITFIFTSKNMRTSELCYIHVRGVTGRKPGLLYFGGCRDEFRDSLQTRMPCRFPGHAVLVYERHSGHSKILSKNKRHVFAIVHTAFLGTVQRGIIDIVYHRVLNSRPRPAAVLVYRTNHSYWAPSHGAYRVPNRPFISTIN